MIVNINPLPEVCILGRDSICVGITTQLSPTTDGTWVSNNPNIASVTNDGLVRGLSAGYATFTFTSSTGCSATTDTISVDVFPVITPTIAERNVVCENTEIELLNNTDGGVWTLSNNNAEIVSLNTENLVIIRGTTKGQVYVTYTVGDGVCQTKSTFLLKIIPDTQPKIIIGMER
jgi:uncharacterized protein YjdB